MSRRAAVVVGGSSGIGLATVEGLARRGRPVMAWSRHAGGCEALATGFPEVGWSRCDVTDEASVDSACEATLERMGDPEVLVYCAGTGVFGSAADTDVGLASQLFDVNYFGAVRVVRRLLSHLATAPGGRVVLVGSLAARAPIPFQSHYSASKAALAAFARSLASEVRPLGVRVTLVEPGDIATPFNEATTWLPPSLAFQRGADAVEERIRAALPLAPPPATAAAVICDACSSPRPPLIRSVGRERRPVAAGVRLLPVSLQHRLIERHFGLTGSSRRQRIGRLGRGPGRGLGA